MILVVDFDLIALVLIMLHKNAFVFCKLKGAYATILKVACDSDTFFRNSIIEHEEQEVS
jgi:hypothetical protein